MGFLSDTIEKCAVCQKHLRATLNDVRRDLETATVTLVRIGTTLAGAGAGEREQAKAMPSGVPSSPPDTWVEGVAQQVYRIEELSATVRNFANHVEMLLDGYDKGRDGAGYVEIPGPNPRR